MDYSIEAADRIILFIFLLYQAPLHDTLCGELHIMKFVFVYTLWATIPGRSSYFLFKFLLKCFKQSLHDASPHSYHCK